MADHTNAQPYQYTSGPFGAAMAAQQAATQAAVEAAREAAANQK